MLFSHDTLIGLLENRHELFVQLGRIDSYMAAVRDGPTSSSSGADAVRMRDLAEALERQVGEINRLIAQFSGPIPHEARLFADPVSRSRQIPPRRAGGRL